MLMTLASFFILVQYACLYVITEKILNPLPLLCNDYFCTSTVDYKKETMHDIATRL